MLLPVSRMNYPLSEQLLPLFFFSKSPEALLQYAHPAITQRPLQGWSANTYPAATNYKFINHTVDRFATPPNGQHTLIRRPSSS